MSKKLESNLLKNLPVHSISDDVLAKVGQGVQIISSPTGSGKTLTIPTKWADRLPEGERVIVLVPRRFLAINAAETVAELSGTVLGEEVGYAVGTQGGDEPLYNKNSKIVFMTYGYAISSSSLMYEKNIVLDEVHESSLDISIVKAILQNRKATDQNLNIIEMSATIDLDKQINYWKDFNPTAHQCEGKTFDCEIIEEDEKSEAEMAVELLQDRGRKGIAIFESGRREIEEAFDELKTELEKNKIQDVEVACIYGEMDCQERRKALAAPAKGKRKILIGTNVIESGMNIPWLDAGISSGKGKGLYATSSQAVVLKEDDLPQWRLQQQKGRVCRFTDGIFVLAADKKWDDRPMQTVAEISRLPLSELVLSCAKFGLKTEELHFDAKIDGQQLRMAQTKLRRLKLIDENNKITDLGRYVTNLPVSPETGLILKYAQSREYCLPQAIVLAGVIEQGSLRQNYNNGHNQDRSSDTFDDLLAFVRVEKELANLRKRNKFRQEQAKAKAKTFAQRLKDKAKSASELKDEALSYPKREEIFQKYNVSKKRFYEARETIKDLSKRFKIRLDLTDDNFDFGKLKQCMLAGHISRLHINDENIFDTDRNNISRSSLAYGYSWNRFLATPKVISPRNGGRPFTILENVTKIGQEDISKFIAKNMDLVQDCRDDGLFSILDSYPIQDEAATEPVKNFYQQKVKSGLDILNTQGEEPFKQYVAQHKIPNIFWKKEIGNSETSKEDAEREVLGLPDTPKPYNLHALLDIRDGGYTSQVVLDEALLREKGLIEDNKLKIEIRPKYAVKLKLNNPELEARITLVGGYNKNVDLSECRLKSLQFEAAGGDFNNNIDFRYSETDRLEFNGLKAHNIALFDSKAKEMLLNDTKATWYSMQYAKVNRFELNNCNIHYLEQSGASFTELPNFNNSEIESIDHPKAKSIGYEFYFIKGEKGYFVSKVSAEELQKREQEKLEQERLAAEAIEAAKAAEAEALARQRQDDLLQLQQAMITGLGQNLCQMSNEDIIKEAQRFMLQNRDNLAFSPSLQELGQMVDGLYEERKKQAEAAEKKPVLREAEDERPVDAKAQSKEQAEGGLNLINLANAWGASLFKKKGGRK